MIGGEQDLSKVIQGKVGITAIAIMIMAVGMGVADNLLESDKKLDELKEMSKTNQNLIMGNVTLQLFTEIQIYLQLSMWIFVILGIGLMVLNLRLK